MATLEKNILAASVLGTKSVSHEWKKAPCQYKEIMDMIAGNKIGDIKTIKIMDAFNKNRKMQLDKIADQELIEMGFYDD